MSFDTFLDYFVTQKFKKLIPMLVLGKPLPRQYLEMYFFEVRHV
jgi:hypothetical protein